MWSRDLQFFLIFFLEKGNCFYFFGHILDFYSCFLKGQRKGACTIGDSLNWGGRESFASHPTPENSIGFSRDYGPPYSSTPQKIHKMLWPFHHHAGTIYIYMLKFCVSHCLILCTIQHCCVPNFSCLLIMISLAMEYVN